MKRPLRQITTCAALGIAVAMLALLCWFAPHDDYSESERRPLAAAPELTAETVLDGSFMEDFEGYAQDAFPFRDSFRAIKALAQLFVFHEADNNGLYVVLADDAEAGESDAAPGSASEATPPEAPAAGIPAYLIDMDYPLDEASVARATERFRLVYETYLADADVRIFNAVIPDKNYYFAKESGHLALDYDALFAQVNEQMPYATAIDLTALLTGESYYRTDVHWRQEALPNVAHALLQAMGAQDANADGTAAGYRISYAREPFYGVYYGQAALPVSPDQLAYLSNDVIDGAVAFDGENNRPIPVYDTNLDVVSGRDLYETFLGGSLSLVTLDNPAATTDRELIVFRDSFASNLAPLLLEGYAKITLVDLRYIQPQVIGQFVEFDGQDVLFLHSAATLNASQF